MNAVENCCLSILQSVLVASDPAWVQANHEGNRLRKLGQYSAAEPYYRTALRESEDLDGRSPAADQRTETLRSFVRRWVNSPPPNYSTSRLSLSGKKCPQQSMLNLEWRTH